MTGIAPVNLDPILTRSAVVLAKVEDEYNVDASPSALTDAVQVEEPNFTVDATVLERNFLRDDISPLADRVGRKLAGLSFGVEFRSNGNTGSGNLSDAAIMGRLLRACGYSESAVSGVATVGAASADAGNTVNPTWGYGGAGTKKNRALYTLTVVAGGASASAKVRVTGGETIDDTTVLPAEGVTATTYRTDDTASTVTTSVDQADPLAVDVTIGGSFQVGDVVRAIVCGVKFEHTVVSGDTDLNGVATALASLIDAHALIAASTTGAVVNITYVGAGAGETVTSATTAFDLGNSGGTATPTWAGSLVLGDSWEIAVYPVGLRYLPVSSNFESITLHFFAGGVLHKLTGCLGTFTLEANAGEYAKANFTFTGQYYDPTDAAVPSDAVFETTTPPLVELAKLRVDGFDAVVAAFSYDQANSIVPRPSVNDSDGYRGVRLVSRAPSGGIDPEATLLRDYNFWEKMSASTEIPFTMKIGEDAGNIILINAPRTQYTSLTYQSRDEMRVYDAGLKFARKDGNDEMEFFFA